MNSLAIVSVHASPVAPLGSGENGGMNVYLRAVCEELSRRGIPTEVFTRQSGGAGTDRVRLADRSWVTRLAVGPGGEVDKVQLFDLMPDFTQAVLDEARRAGPRCGQGHRLRRPAGATERRRDRCPGAGPLVGPSRRAGTAGADCHRG